MAQGMRVYRPIRMSNVHWLIPYVNVSSDIAYAFNLEI